MINPFTADGFTLTELTAAIDQIPFRPGRLGQMGLFEEQGIATTTALVEMRDGVLSLLDVRPRGAPPQVTGNATRRLLPFAVPHLSSRRELLADEVQGVRAFGSDSVAEAIMTRRDEKLAQMRAELEYTLESHRMQAVLGNYIDANGTAQSLFTTFNVSEKSVGFVLATTTTKIRQKCLDVISHVEDGLGGSPYGSIRALCGKDFWASLIEHDAVKDVYKYTADAAALRGDPTLSFEFGGIIFERYRGTSAVKIPDAEARAIPLGVPGLALTRYAPADYIETVNTIGRPQYVKAEPLPMDKGLSLEAQSNPLNLITRPAAVIKLVVGS
jgi:hypothetical protein